MRVLIAYSRPKNFLGKEQERHGGGHHEEVLLCIIHIPPISHLFIGFIFLNWARYIGKDEGLIYLSVLGEVYDVTTGKGTQILHMRQCWFFIYPSHLWHYRPDFYGEDTGYSFFAGKDGTASYFSGEFTDDGLVQSILEYAPKEIKSMEQWRSFYETHESYFFVGKLEGEFYDSKGEPTTYLQDILAKMKEEEVKEL